MNEPIEPVGEYSPQTVARRSVLKGGVAAAGAAVAFAALGQMPADAAVASQRTNRRSADYGPLKPTKDLATGLELISLPEGFSYMSFGWTGQIMDDGRPTPTDHDGMAVVARKGRDIVMVRNHELRVNEGPQSFVPGGMYNPAEFGGTTNLKFNLRTGQFTEHWTSLGGTINNCAGGLTPWKSWITCEETFHPWGSRPDGFNHGYNFDVPAFGISDAKPIRAMGRFSHEAIAVDPDTGWVYETEDATPSALYQYRNPGGKRRLEDGGELYALAIKGEPGKDMTQSFADGQSWNVEWVKVGDPEGQTGRAFDSAPGAAGFQRLEGIWYSALNSGIMYFISTGGGAAGLGQVYTLRVKDDKLKMIYESRDASILDGPDNIAVTERGGVLLCEDGDSNPKRLIGLSPSGSIFEFAQNLIDLKDGDIDIIDAVFPGTKANFWDAPVRNFQSQEWCGATFYDKWLFVNIQSPGVTFAITGPWEKGTLR